MRNRSGNGDPIPMAPAEIRQLSFGVRYEPQFGLIDRLGSVVDRILRADATPFGPETFPLSEANPLQYRLVNNETDASLVINSQDTIMQLPLITRNVAQINEYANHFEEYVLTPLRKIGLVRNIARYGVMIHFKEEKATSLRNPPVTRYLSPDFPKANSLGMQFSRRLPMDEALAMRRVDDYRNANYIVIQSESGDVRVSIDYQEYFRPMLSAREWEERPFSRFVHRGTDYVEGEFQKWFQKFSVMSEVA